MTYIKTPVGIFGYSAFEHLQQSFDLGEFDDRINEIQAAQKTLKETEKQLKKLKEDLAKALNGNQNFIVDDYDDNFDLLSYACDTDMLLGDIERNCSRTKDLLNNILKLDPEREVIE